MNGTITVAGKTIPVSTPTNEESVVWKAIAEHLLNAPIPSKISVQTDIGNTTLSVAARGTYTENGITKPSMYVTVERNLITTASNYTECYLTCIHPESNNYKYYKLLPESGGLYAEYGRIGKTVGDGFGAPRKTQQPYDMYLYWVRYYEKLSKGYIDQTDVYLKSKTVDGTTASKASSTPANENEFLYRLLMDAAHKTVQTTLVGGTASVTLKQVKNARKFFNLMSQRKTVAGFNKQLMSLMQVSPRNVADIRDLMAKSVSDFYSIINREENLLLAMEAVAGSNEKSSKKKGGYPPSFRQFGIHVWTATPQQADHVKKCIGPQFANRIKKVWRVKPDDQEKKFHNYCKKNNITERKELWHGSVNQNWASIIQNSLYVTASAAHGRMFGAGIYFAPSAAKSYNYTSCRGTTWAKGNSNFGFMGLYKTAYGKPYHPTSADHSLKLASIKAKGCDCTHAISSQTGLRADEIIFYDPDAVCLEYLVEIA